MHLEQYKIIFKTSEEDEGTTFYVHAGTDEESWKELNLRYSKLANNSIKIVSMVQKDGN